MLRLAHFTDPHLTEGKRWPDTLAAIEAVIDDAITQGVQLWFVSGDFCGTTDQNHRPTTLEQNTWDVLFQRMANHAPVVSCYGNHDAPNTLDGYARLAARHPIHVLTEPGVVDLDAARVLVFPYPWKRHYVAKYLELSVEEQNLAIREEIAGLLASWKPLVDEAHAAGRPCVLMAHASFDHSALAGGEVMDPGREITLSIPALEALGCAYVGSGHIHLAQEMAPGIWHPGSPSRSNFGEPDEKGYLIVDATPGQLPQVHRRLTPVRRYVTVDATWDTDRFVYEAPEDVAGVELRLRMAIPQEAADVARVAAKELVAQFEAQGAVAVQPEPRTIPKARARVEGLLEARSTVAKLGAYWKTIDPVPDEAIARCLEKLALIEAGAPIPTAETFASERLAA